MPTILDKIDGKFVPPLPPPPKSWMGKWRVLAFARLHPLFEGDGGLLFHFILSKIVPLLTTVNALSLKLITSQNQAISLTQSESYNPSVSIFRSSYRPK